MCNSTDTHTVSVPTVHPFPYPVHLREMFSSRGASTAAVSHISCVCVCERVCMSVFACVCVNVLYVCSVIARFYKRRHSPVVAVHRRSTTTSPHTTNSSPNPSITRLTTLAVY